MQLLWTRCWRQRRWAEIWEGSPAAVNSQIAPRVALAVGAQVQRPGSRAATLSTQHRGPNETEAGRPEGVAAGAGCCRGHGVCAQPVTAGRGRVSLFGPSSPCQEQAALASSARYSSDRTRCRIVASLHSLPAAAA
ncbi:hypothetical protein SVAN01_06268 [Stagonosporopsis vannaccii]|nr:hypothetical protein SVAN01_06268 [Stagonosporopsis vannaccii]